MSNDKFSVGLNIVNGELKGKGTCFDEHIVVPVGVKSVGRSAFSLCKTIKSIVFSEGLETIEDSAFYSSTLKEIKLPSTLKKIGKDAFSYCKGLRKIVVPKEVKTLGKTPFFSCKNLVIYFEVSKSCPTWATGWNFDSLPLVFDCLNNDVATDGNIYFEENGIFYALKDSKAVVIRQANEIKNAIIPDKITYKEKTYLITKIVKNAFFRCNVLSKVEIPNTIEEIGQSAFGRCAQLDRIFYRGTIKEWDRVNKRGERWKRQFSSSCVFYCLDEASEGLYIENGVLKGVGDCKDKVIIIPNEVIKIDDFAFKGNKNIVDVIFNNNVKSIGVSAFSDCVRLKKVIINNIDCAIEKSAFYNCKSLKEIALPKNIKCLKEGIFERCMSLTKIEIPSTVTKIEKYAFSQCIKLRIVKVEDKHEWKVLKDSEDADSTLINIEEINAELLTDKYKDCCLIKE